MSNGSGFGFKCKKVLIYEDIWEWSVIAEHGAPGYIRSDNGPEFMARNLQWWLAGQQIKTLYIEPGSPRPAPTSLGGAHSRRALVNLVRKTCRRRAPALTLNGFWKSSLPSPSPRPIHLPVPFTSSGPKSERRSPALAR